jgi:hypothetical protein
MRNHLKDGLLKALDLVAVLGDSARLHQHLAMVDCVQR